MQLAGCNPMKMFLVSYEEILNDVTKYKDVRPKKGVKSRGVRNRLFWTPAPVLTNQTPDPAPGQ